MKKGKQAKYLYLDFQPQADKSEAEPTTAAPEVCNSFVSTAMADPFSCNYFFDF